jgi:hypothetical protein
MVLSLSHQRGKKPKKQNTTNCPKFKCNSVSVSFSACRCSSVVVSSRKRKKRVWRQVCECLSEAVAHLPTAVSLLLLEALFMQISGVSLALTWPLRLCLLRVLLDATATVTSFPLSKHTGGGGATHTFSGGHVYLQLTWEVPPSPLSCGVFLPLPLLQAFPLQDCWVGAATPAFSIQLVYLQFREGLPLPHFGAQGTLPSLLCVFFVVVIIQFFFSFFPWVGFSLSRGLCWSGPGLSVGVLRAA